MTTELTERAGLGSASNAWLTKLCSANVALRERIRREGLLIELDDKETKDGKIIHSRLRGLKVDLNEKQESTYKMSVALRHKIVLAWSDGEFVYSDEDSLSDGRFQVIREERLWYRAGLQPIFSGQGDLIIIDQEKNRALIADYKTGRMDLPETVHNMQLRTEAVLLKHEYPSIEQIDCETVQPWIAWDPVLARYEGELFAEAESEIVKIFTDAIYSPKFNPGDHCAWCDCRANCRVGLRYASKVIPLTAKIEENIINLPGGELGDETLDKIAAAERIFKTLKEAYKARLLVDKDFLPSRHITDGNRAIEDPVKAWLVVQQYITAEAFIGCCNVSVGDLQEVVGAVKHWKKKESGEKFDELMGEIVKRGEPKMLKLSKKELAKRAR